MSEQKVCPRCRTPNEIPVLVKREYRCAGCGLELAHLDMAANGAVRGVFGWLLDLDTVVNERYRIAAVLGKGGFGVTYLADDLRLAGKRRALKEIPELLFDEYETRLLGRLNHPAIPDIIDRLSVGGMIYLVLEFGGSRTLRSEQDRQGGRIPIFVLIPWVEQICDALMYLHSQDPPIIHRDLKPDNILLDDNDRVMLIDFGIAKETGGDNVTRTLGRAVTHGFSPPEQVLGTGTDARSDVYALGAILYAAITGKTPPAAHERVTGTALEPPSNFFPDIPPLLDAAIRQALELNLHTRQQTIAELARTLELVRSGGTSARTVFVSDTSTLTAGLGTSREVHLASVQLPSTRYTQGAARVEDRTAQPVPEVQRGGRLRGLVWSGVGLALAGLVTVVGWVYLQETGPKQAATPNATATPAQPASPEPAQAAGPAPAATPVSRVPVVVGPPTPAPPESVRAGPETAIDAPVSVAPSGASPVGPQAHPSATRAEPSTARPVANVPPTVLPSIFSYDQNAVIEPTTQAPAGSLWDSTEGLGKAPTPTSGPATPGVVPTTQPPPRARPPPDKPPVTAKQDKVPPNPPKPKPPTKQPSGNSSWTIQYQGARKTD